MSVCTRLNKRSKKWYIHHQLMGLSWNECGDKENKQTGPGVLQFKVWSSSSSVGQLFGNLLRLIHNWHVPNKVETVMDGSTAQTSLSFRSTFLLGLILLLSNYHHQVSGAFTYRGNVLLIIGKSTHFVVSCFGCCGKIFRWLCLSRVCFETLVLSSGTILLFKLSGPVLYTWYCFNCTSLWEDSIRG